MTSTYMLNLKSEGYYRNFKESIRSKDTLDSYDRKLKAFMKYKRISAGDFAALIEGKDSREIETDIIDFIISLKQKRYSLATQQAYLYGLIHFYDVNDVTTIRRKKIAKFLSNDDSLDSGHDLLKQQSEAGDAGGGGGDRPYTHEQIAKLIDRSDLREKVIILLMSSSGMRIGALPFLKVGDLTPIETHQIYQIRVYANSKSSRHHTFCTPECRKYIDSYLEFRRQCGENISPKSPLLRREFNERDIFAAANDIKPLSRPAIRTALHQVLYKSGVRTPLVLVSGKNPLNYRRDIAIAWL